MAKNETNAVVLPITLGDEKEIDQVIITRDTVDAILVNNVRNTCIILTANGMKLRIDLPASEVSAMIYGKDFLGNKSKKKVTTKSKTMAKKKTSSKTK